MKCDGRWLKTSVSQLWLAGLLALAATPAARAADQTWPAARPDAIKRWQDMRLGMFIHWGPVSLTGKELSWSRGAPTPIAEYDSLYKKFDPEKFNADDWVTIAKNAGMKYIVLTAKHADGFCLWNTKYTDYNIMNTPFKRDVVKELSEACKKQGIAFGVYYSVSDWYDPNWPTTSPGGRVLRKKYDLDLYEQYLQNQIKELITNYGPLLTIWNDKGENSWMGWEKYGANTIKLARQLQPDILINDRTGDGGDYSTPEQKIGGYNDKRPWESCMTISAHNHWAWGGEKDGVKDLSTCVQFLVQIAGGDGNMLLNVGPEPTGEINRLQQDRLKQMGDWMQKYGESIYATRGGPFKPAKDFVSTRKENFVYVHILRWQGDTLQLPAIGKKILKSEALTGGNVNVSQDDKGITISLPAADHQPIDTIIKLELDGPAADIAPIAPGVSR